MLNLEILNSKLFTLAPVYSSCGLAEAEKALSVSFLSFSQKN